jgi:hypothetical protein
VLYIPELTVNFLSVSALDESGFGVVFYGGHVFLYPVGATVDTTVMLGVKYEGMYRLLGRPVLGSNGFLDFRFCVGELAGSMRERVDTGDSVFF